MTGVSFIKLCVILITLQTGIPYAEVLCKNRYVGRTFIQPSTRLRQLGVAKKFGPLSDNFHGKRIILIDDSIVRGTTVGSIIKLLKEAGAKEVCLRKTICSSMLCTLWPYLRLCRGFAWLELFRYCSTQKKKKDLL